jgi:lipopolysaccharide transport protein LptA
VSRPPRARHPLRWIRGLHSLFAVGLSAVLVVIAVYFLTHLKRPSQSESSTEGFTPQKIEVQESASHFEFDRGLSRMDIKFNRRYLGSDGLYHLEGGVEVVDHGKKGGRDIRINADQAVTDKDQTMARFTGRVSIASKGMTLLAESFAYDKSRDLLFNETGMTMRSERFTGSARRYAYSLRDETVVLEGDIVFSIRPQIGDSEFLVVRGDRMVFNYSQRRAHIEGGIDLRHGRSRGTADAVEIQLFEKKDNIHLLWLMGRARIVMREAPKPAKAKAKARPAAPKDAVPGVGQSDQSLFLFDSADQDITADQILMAAFEDVRRLRGVRARGSASFVLSSAEGQTTRIEGDAVNFVFDPIRGLEAVDVRGPGRLRGVSKEVPGGRSIEGRFILYDGFERVLKAGGNEQNPARSISEGRDVRAENLVLFFQSNSFDAWGSVKAVLEDNPAPGTAPAGGFFAAGKPVFARARLVRFIQSNQELLLSDKVRLWQDKQVLEGPEIAINKETQAMRGTQGVKTQFSHAPKAGGSDERVEVGGERMDYDPKTRVIVFSGNGYLLTKDVDIRAEAVAIVPEASAGKPRFIQARRSVVLKQKAREGRSEAADYDVGLETVVLTGHPVVVDKEKGTFRGDKLTFHLADGNIRVDNRDQQRSDVVIKS